MTLSGFGLVGGLVLAGTLYTGMSGTSREAEPVSFFRGSLSPLEDLGVVAGDIPRSSPISSTLSGVFRSASVGVIPVDRLRGEVLDLLQFYEITLTWRGTNDNTKLITIKCINTDRQDETLYYRRSGQSCFLFKTHMPCTLLLWIFFCLF